MGDKLDPERYYLYLKNSDGKNVWLQIPDDFGKKLETDPVRPFIDSNFYYGEKCRIFNEKLEERKKAMKEKYGP